MAFRFFIQFPPSGARWKLESFTTAHFQLYKFLSELHIWRVERHILLLSGTHGIDVFWEEFGCSSCFLDDYELVITVNFFFLGSIDRTSGRLLPTTQVYLCWIKKGVPRVPHHHYTVVLVSLRDDGLPVDVLFFQHQRRFQPSRRVRYLKVAHGFTCLSVCLSESGDYTSWALLCQICWVEGNASPAAIGFQAFMLVLHICRSAGVLCSTGRVSAVDTISLTSLPTSVDSSEEDVLSRL